MEYLSGPWTTALAALISAAGGWVVARMVRREDLVDELRRALDRGRIRENALVVCCDLLVFAIDHMEEPPPAVLELRTRARDVLIAARRLTHGKGEQ